MSVILNPYRYASSGGDEGFNPETDVSSATLTNWLEPDSFDSANNLWETKSSTGGDWAVDGSGVSLVTGGAEYNNENVVQFDGTDYIYPLTYEAFSGLTAAECFLLIDIDEDPPSGVAKTGLWIFGGAFNEVYPGTDGVIKSNFASNGNKTVGNPSVSLTDPRIVNIWSAPSDWQYNLDNSSLYSTTSNTVQEDIYPTIGQGLLIPGFTEIFLSGRIRAFLFYDGKLSSDDRDAVYNYINAMRA